MTEIINPKAQSKWDGVKAALKEGLSPSKAKMFDTLLENTRRDYASKQRFIMENASASAVSTANIATLTKVVLPMMRRVAPNTIANELVGVQPMPGPVAQAVSIRYVYGNNAAGARAGEEMLAPRHIRDIAAAFSGNEVAGNPAGALTAQMEGVPGNAVKLEVVKQLVEAKTRRLSARWTPEAQADTYNMYTVSVEDELMGAVAQEITIEQDQEILRSLRALPPAPTAANTYNQAAVSGQPHSVVDEFAALSVLIHRQRNLIATKTRRDRGNWAVVSPTALTILEAARASAFVRTTEGDFDAPSNNKFVGTLNGSLKVYVDTFADDDTPILIGYKGSDVDAATYFMPYVPLTTHGTVTDPDTFEFVTSFYTRYAYLEFVSTNTSLGNSADYLGLVGMNASTISFL